MLLSCLTREGEEGEEGEEGRKEGGEGEKRENGKVSCFPCRLASPYGRTIPNVVYVRVHTCRPGSMAVNN